MLVNWRRVAFWATFFYLVYTHDVIPRLQTERELESTATSQTSPITLRVNPKICIAPCSVTYSVIVHRHDDNQRWSIAWGAQTGHEGYDERPHSKNAPFELVDDLPDLPSGYYGVQTCIHRPKEHFCAYAEFDVRE